MEIHSLVETDPTLAPVDCHVLVPVHRHVAVTVDSHIPLSETHSRVVTGTNSRFTIHRDVVFNPTATRHSREDFGEHAGALICCSRRWRDADKNDGLQGNRYNFSRPCFFVKSMIGPSGTIRVGLISSCVM